MHIGTDAHDFSLTKAGYSVGTITVLVEQPLFTGGLFRFELVSFSYKLLDNNR